MTIGVVTEKVAPERLATVPPLSAVRSAVSRAPVPVLLAVAGGAAAARDDSQGTAAPWLLTVSCAALPSPSPLTARAEPVTILPVSPTTQPRPVPWTPDVVKVLLLK